MKKIKRIFSLVLLILMLVCMFSGCTRVPKDEIKINVITSKGTYHREEDVTEIFFALDVLNGKERDIKRFEMDIVFYMQDGTSFQDTISYDKKIDYARSQLVRFTIYPEGRVDHLDVQGYRVETVNYWKTFGGLILSSCAIFLVVGIIFAFLMAGEMTGILSVGAGAVVLFDIAMLLIAPFAEAIIMILASILAFAPMLIYHFVSEY